MEIDNNITSDCAALGDIVDALFKGGISVRTMRDVTRGGLGTVINEIAESSAVKIELQEESIPVNPEVKGFADILGLDPLYMGNEGKMIAVVPSGEADKALEIMRNTEHGADAAVIGCVEEGQGAYIKTRLGATRRFDVLYGEGLPRICKRETGLYLAGFLLDAADYENLGGKCGNAKTPARQNIGRVVNSAVNSGESYSEHKKYHYCGENNPQFFIGYSSVYEPQKKSEAEHAYC